MLSKSWKWWLNHSAWSLFMNKVHFKIIYAMVIWFHIFYQNHNISIWLFKNRYYYIYFSLKKRLVCSTSSSLSVLEGSSSVTPSLRVQQDWAGVTEVVALDGDGDDPDRLRNEFWLNKDRIWFFILTLDLLVKKVDFIYNWKRKLDIFYN